MPEEIRRAALFPPGHFYSPIVDTVDVAARESAIWPVRPPVLAGIDFNVPRQKDFIEQDVIAAKPFFDYPETRAEVNSDVEFFRANGLAGLTR